MEGVQGTNRKLMLEDAGADRNVMEGLEGWSKKILRGAGVRSKSY